MVVSSARRLRHGDAWSQLTDHFEVVRAERLHDLVGTLVIDRHPQLHGCLRITKPGGQNADDRVRLQVHENGVADDRWIAGVAALPQPPAQDDGGVRFRPVIVAGEEPSQRGLHAEHGQCVP